MLRELRTRIRFRLGNDLNDLLLCVFLWHRQHLLSGLVRFVGGNPVHRASQQPPRFGRWCSFSGRTDGCVPYQVFRDWNAIATVESDLFRQLMMDGYAHLVWPYMMGAETPREAYSGYDPAWILAHSAGFWVQELTDKGIIPTVETLYQSARPEDSFGDVSLEELDRILRYIVPKAMEHYRMYDVLDVVEQHRCFEDFDTRKSNAKTDFFRKWYHTRTKYQTVSWEDYIAEDEGYSDGATPEEAAVSKVLVEQFFATLSEKDRRILALRMEGICLEDIAKELGYSNHSGVLKRIQRIGQAYEAFTQTDLGF